MPRLPCPPGPGAWFITLLSFTYAWPSRLDSSLRTKWKGLIPSLNVPKMDALMNSSSSSSSWSCCSSPTPPLTETPWIHYKHIPQTSIPQSQKHFLTAKFKQSLLRGDPKDYGVLNPKTALSKRKQHLGDSRSILSLLEIERRMLLNKPTVKSHDFPLLRVVYDKNNGDYRLNLNDVNSSSSHLTQSPIKRGWGRPFTKNFYINRKNDRFRIGPLLLRRFPFSNIVRLSTGCTGTLVTPIHVLTAAHCVHDGHEFRNKLEMLKVEIPGALGVRSYYVEKIIIPEKWLNPQIRIDRGAPNDFAVVRLSFGVHGRSKFMPLAVPPQGVLHERLQFLGFPLNSFGLWRSVCYSKSNKFILDGNLLLTRCDSSRGNSGAAVLAGDGRAGHQIIGVLSSTMATGPTPFYNIVTALTWSKLHDICTQIGRIGVEHGVCPDIETIAKSRRFHHHNKVIPFFG